MSLWAVVPVKPLRRGKSRLAGILSTKDREYLNEQLLKRTITSLKPVKEIDEIIVISYDPAALSLSRKFGIRTLQENRNTNINNALRKATMAAKGFHASKILIVPADLPLISSEDIENMLNLQARAPEIIIAPDRRMDGTNALLINPIGILDYDFGIWSFRKHVEQAERKKIRVEIYDNENLAFDLDIPEDLEYLKNLDVSKNMISL